MAIIVITNRTAFPLNIALVRILPLQHTNGLEPGESWATAPPSHLPFLTNRNAPGPSSAHAVPQSSRRPSPLGLALRYLDRWMGPGLALSSTTVIEVRFDHEHNRFCRRAALHSLSCGVLRISGYLLLSISLSMTLGRSILAYYASAPSPRSASTSCTHAVLESVAEANIPSLSLAVLGLLLLACSRIGKHRRHSCPSNPPRTKPILSVPVATSSLRPSSFSSPSSSIPPPPPLLPPPLHLSSTLTHSTPIADATARAHRHFAVTWRLGRFVLWDVHLEQEVVPDDPRWR